MFYQPLSRLPLMVFVCVSSFLFCGGNARAEEPGHFLKMPADLIPLSDPQGQRLLKETSLDQAFWQLSQFYNTQPDLGSCGLASCITVLNALPIPRPLSRPHGEYRLFTPDNFFTPEVERIVTRRQVSGAGMTLDQLAKVLSTYPLVVDRQYASETIVDAFREKVKQSLSHPGSIVLVNYLRSALQQETGGHISPLGAYHAERDMVLILDTANYKYPWTWVKVPQLWDAMSTSTDPESNRSRGFVTVSQKAGK